MVDKPMDKEEAQEFVEKYIELGDRIIEAPDYDPA